MGKITFENLFYLGRKAEFMRQKLLKLEGKVLSDREIIVKEVRDLVSSFNEVCEWGEIPCFVERVESGVSGRACHKAEDLLYRVEAVIAVANAGESLANGGNFQPTITPGFGQGGDYEERS